MTLFRRAAVGTFAAAAAVGLSTLFATAASAHSVGPTGSANCYTVTWTVRNDWSNPVDVTKISSSDGKTFDNILNLGAHQSKSWTFTYDASTKKDLTLTVSAHWQDGYSDTKTSSPVHLGNNCATPTTKPPTTPPATTQPPTTPAAPKTPEASKSATPSLPVTGSSSTLPLVGTGAALVVAGAGLVVTLRRRRRVTFTAE